MKGGHCIAEALPAVGERVDARGRSGGTVGRQVVATQGVDDEEEDALGRLAIRFYLIAILFILFDVEVVFLYPWAVVYRELGMLGLVEMSVFLGVLLVGFVYAWDRKALEWR